MIKFRYESFGGIVSSTHPSFLAYVNRDLARLLGKNGGELWQNEMSWLSAPTEVHFAVTNRCNAGCSHCYMDSKEETIPDASFEEIKSMLDILAQKKVFHVAMGGGEAFLREDLFGIAGYARSIGIVPNLTTNGLYITPLNVDQCRVFGQINVSLDTAIDHKEQPRGDGAVNFALAAIRLLRKKRIKVGINTVLTRKTFPMLESLFALAKKERIKEIEILRLKPSGRGKTVYHELRCTDRQNRGIYPLLMQLARRYHMITKVDCSLMPMVCYHNPNKQKLIKFAAVGCEAGNIILGASPDGMIAPCSFAPTTGRHISELDAMWDTDEILHSYRTWTENAPMPCRECNYLDLCKGGCHPLAQFETGDFFHGDPGCPWVAEYIE